MFYIIAWVFGLMETGYFGWNMFPHSSAEMICDGITLMLFFMARIISIMKERKDECNRKEQ